MNRPVASRPAWATPFFGLRALLALLAFILCIIYLAANANINLIVYAVMALSVAVFVP